MMESVLPAGFTLVEFRYILDTDNPDMVVKVTVATLVGVDVHEVRVHQVPKPRPYPAEIAVQLREFLRAKYG